MTYKDVAAMISGIGLPYAYDHFPDNEGPDPPFICFYFSGADDFKADDSNYQKIRPLTVELYTENKDFETEATVEAVLDGLVYSRSESYIDSERLYMVAYETDIILTEEQDNG